MLHLAKFMSFADYQSFIHSLWPADNENDIIPEKMWQLSTFKFVTVFMNGKRLEIENNFDPSKIKEDRILIKLDSLLPMFGSVVPPAMDKF